MEKKLESITKQAMLNAWNHPDFDMDDYERFADIVDKITTLKGMQLKPLRVIWYMNYWEPFNDYIYDVMDYFGYKFIGNMDLADGKYQFDTDDAEKDILFIYQGEDCDYSRLKIISN